VFIVSYSFIVLGATVSARLSRATACTCTCSVFAFNELNDDLYCREMLATSLTDRTVPGQLRFTSDSVNNGETILFYKITYFYIIIYILMCIIKHVAWRPCLE